MAKNHFSVQKKLNRLNNEFWVKMLKLLENYVKIKAWEGFSHLFYFENFVQKVKKKWCFAHSPPKITFLAPICLNFKNIA